MNMVRIIVVEDEKPIQLGIVSMIERMEPDYHVLGSFGNGLEAMRFLNTQAVDVVITDISMPKMDGFELAEHVRKQYPRTHIVILSGFNQFEYVRNALRKGVSDYLVKPVNKKELAQMLQQVRDRMQEEQHQREPEAEAYERKVVSTVKRIIEQAYHREIELSELANQVYLTASYVSFLFRKETGMTITDYIMQLRVTKAKELLLRQLELKTYEVGQAVGYPDAAYFNRLFKKVVGMTPRMYREQTKLSHLPNGS